MSEKFKSGVIKMFKTAQGYGIIKPDENGPDVFAHFSVMDINTKARMITGLPVLYEVIQDEKGYKATRVWMDLDFTWMTIPDDKCSGHRFAIRDDTTGIVDVFATRAEGRQWIAAIRQKRAESNGL